MATAEVRILVRDLFDEADKEVLGQEFAASARKGIVSRRRARFLARTLLGLRPAKFGAMLRGVRFKDRTWTQTRLPAGHA